MSRSTISRLSMGGTWSVGSPAFTLSASQALTEPLHVTQYVLIRVDFVIDPNTHDLMTILDDEELVASAVVYPSSAEEVQKIVVWANKHLIPIFPISMGRNRKPNLPLTRVSLSLLP